MQLPSCLYPTYSTGCSQWLAIWMGATIAYADSPATMMADLQKYNPTWFSCVPRLYERIYMAFQQMLEASPMKKRLFTWALGVGEEVLSYPMDQFGRYDMRPEYPLCLPLGLRIKYKIADKPFAMRELFGSRFPLSFSASATSHQIIKVLLYGRSSRYRGLWVNRNHQCLYLIP